MRAECSQEKKPLSLLGSTLLDGVSLDLMPGAMPITAGGRGSGKSTPLNPTRK